MNKKNKDNLKYMEKDEFNKELKKQIDTLRKIFDESNKKQNESHTEEER